MSAFVLVLREAPFARACLARDDQHLRLLGVRVYSLGLGGWLWDARRNLPERCLVTSGFECLCLRDAALTLWLKLRVRLPFVTLPSSCDRGLEDKHKRIWLN